MDDVSDDVYDEYCGSSDDDDPNQNGRTIKRQKMGKNQVDFDGFVSVFDLENDLEILEERPTSLAYINNLKSNNKSYLNPTVENSSSPFLDELANCPICLENLDNPSIPDCCTHQFCFICIVHWGSTTSTCPMCKRKFTFILHSIKSASEYKRFYPKEENGPKSKNPSITSTTRSTQSISLSTTQRTKKEGAPPPLFLTDAHELRRSVYVNGLRAKSNSNLQKKIRPDLKQFITRDLQSILQIEEVDILVEMIMGLFKKYETFHKKQNFSEIQNHLKDYLPSEYISTLIHEIQAFNSSMHPNLTVYDKHVKYEKN